MKNGKYTHFNSLHLSVLVLLTIALMLRNWFLTWCLCWTNNQLSRSEPWSKDVQPRLNKFVLLYLKPITQVWELLLGHVGIFLDSSGSQLSFEHKHKTILPKNCWENCIWSWVPYCKRKANELWVHFTLYSIILAYPTKELLNLIQF